MTNPKLTFVHLAPDVWAKLETEPRAGWVARGIPNPETVAEHTIDLLSIAAEVGPANGFSVEECIDLNNMLEVHDWPEAVHGDEMTLHGVDLEKEKDQKAMKFAREEAAMKHITTSLGSDGERIFSLWMRFETGSDRAAEKAREIDKFQAIERAFLYEHDKLGPQGLGEEFVRYSPPITDLHLLARLRRVRK